MIEIEQFFAKEGFETVIMRSGVEVFKVGQYNIERIPICEDLDMLEETIKKTPVLVNGRPMDAALDENGVWSLQNATFCGKMIVKQDGALVVVNCGQAFPVLSFQRFVEKLETKYPFVLERRWTAMLEGPNIKLFNFATQFIRNVAKINRHQYILLLQFQSEATNHQLHVLGTVDSRVFVIGMRKGNGSLSWVPQIKYVKETFLNDEVFQLQLFRISQSDKEYQLAPQIYGTDLDCLGPFFQKEGMQIELDPITVSADYVFVLGTSFKRIFKNQSNLTNGKDKIVVDAAKCMLTDFEKKILTTLKNNGYRVFIAVDFIEQAQDYLAFEPLLSLCPVLHPSVDVSTSVFCMIGGKLKTGMQAAFDLIPKEPRPTGSQQSNSQFAEPDSSLTNDSQQFECSPLARTHTLPALKNGISPQSTESGNFEPGTPTVSERAKRQQALLQQQASIRPSPLKRDMSMVETRPYAMSMSTRSSIIQPSASTENFPESHGSGQPRRLSNYGMGPNQQNRKKISEIDRDRLATPSYLSRAPKALDIRPPSIQRSRSVLKPGVAFSFRDK